MVSEARRPRHRDAFATTEGSLELVYSDAVAGIYKKLVISEDCTQLLGGIRAFVGLSLALGVAMPYWPYGHSCGWGLAFYSVGIMTVLTAGVWTSILTWYSRLGVSHVIAVLVFAWGITLSVSHRWSSETIRTTFGRTAAAASGAAWTSSAPPRVPIGHATAIMSRMDPSAVATRRPPVAR